MEDCANIESLSINNTDESTGVTTFVQEACEAVEVLGKHYVSPSSHVAQPELQDLKEYFRRPRIVSSGTLTLGVRSRLFAISVDRDVLLGTFFPSGITRLMGVQGLRFRLVFTLQVACTPFHQGVLALSWQYSTAATPTTNTFCRSLLSAACTNIPHVRLDMSQTTMAQLGVPYLNPLEYMTLGVETTNALPYGTVALNALLPLASGVGASAPTYKLLAHLEDLELIGATPMSVTDVVPQSGRKLKPMDDEIEQASHPFSSAIYAGSRVLKWISYGVPAISSVAGTASWFLDKSAGVVRHFGFSKPQMQDPIHRNHLSDNIFEHNVDVPSGTTVIGPLASNHLKIDPKFASTDVDEMSLSFVLSQWSQICVGKMADTAGSGTLLYGTQVSPMFFWFRAQATGPYFNIAAPVKTVDGCNSFMPSNLLFWSSMFKQWRGDLEFRFTFSKTKLHGGRVVISMVPDKSSFFAPRNNDGKPVLKLPEIANGAIQPFGHSMICDLRDGNTFVFRVPFVSDTPFANVRETIGSLSMCVLDSLQTTTTIASSADFMVEVRAVPGFELAIPTGPVYAPQPLGIVQGQSGRILSNISDDVSQLTIGESIGSIKQLIMMPKHSYFTVPTTTNYTTTIPSWWYQPKQPTVLPSSGFAPESFGFAGVAASCYLFARGGSDIHVTVNGSNGNYVQMLYFAAQDFNSGLLYTSPENVPSVSRSRVLSTRNAVHGRFPAYGKLVRYTTDCFNSAAWDPVFAPNSSYSDSDMVPSQFARYKVSNNTGGTLSCWMSRCAADDAMLGHYMGPTPLRLNRTEALGAYDPDSVVFQTGRNLKLCCEDDTVTPVEEFKEPTPPSARVSGSRGIFPTHLSGRLTEPPVRPSPLVAVASIAQSVADVAQALC